MKERIENKNCDNTKKQSQENNKPSIIEVEIKKDSNLVFFGSCHCSNSKLGFDNDF